MEFDSSLLTGSLALTGQQTLETTATIVTTPSLPALDPPWIENLRLRDRPRRISVYNLIL